MATVIASFSPQDKVPGAYGEVQYGTSGQSAATLPLFLLLVGIASGGNLAVDNEIRQVYSKADVDVAALAGGELAWMGYDAIDTASSVPTFLAAPKEAGGAVAGNATLLAAGTPGGTGYVTLRAGGKSLTLPVQSTDTATTFAATAALLVKGALNGRFPITATSVAGALTLTWKSKGTRGNQAVIFLDTTNAPSGFTCTLTGNVWSTATAFALNAYAHPTAANTNGFYYKATAIAGTGTTDPAVEPTWPTTVGTTVVDNSGVNQITWTCWGQIVTGGGVTLGGGSGLETYTNLLSTLATSQYDRVALACNDSVSLGVWKTQIDSQVLAPQNILQMIGCTLNGTLTAANTAASTTLNDQVFQVGWCLNSETHPSRIAASLMALRAQGEAVDPCAAYNYTTLPTVAPMSQKPDWPSHAQLVSALNNGVTPITSTGDGTAKIVRSITSHCLLSGNADYSTLDTSQASVPQFVLKDLKLYWTTVVAPANPRVQDDPTLQQRNPPTGVMFPRLWGSLVYAKLQLYALGVLSGTSVTVPPILINVVPPVANFDNAGKRIMISATVTPAYNNAQCGISIRQAA